MSIQEVKAFSYKDRIYATEREARTAEFTDMVSILIGGFSPFGSVATSMIAGWVERNLTDRMSGKSHVDGLRAVIAYLEAHRETMAGTGPAQ